MSDTQDSRSTAQWGAQECGALGGRPTGMGRDSRYRYQKQRRRIDARQIVYTGDWRPQAACDGADTNLFYPPGGDATRAANAAQYVKKRFCEHCPVWKACLEEALRNDERGVWGGKTETERRAMTRARA